MAAESERRALPILTEYAEACVSGKIAAGAPVKGLARRHLLDLERMESDDSFPSRFDEGRALDAIDFLQDEITIFDKRIKDYVPLVLLDWQLFLVGSLFGWVIRDDRRDPKARLPGTRRFRKCTLLTGRGTGKSVLAAGITLYMARRDNRRLRAYVIASTENQAGIILDHAIGMVERNRGLDRIATFIKGNTRQGGKIRLESRALGLDSRIETISGIASGSRMSGYHPDLLVADEIQEHYSGGMRDVMEAGFTDAVEPLLLSTCNAGHQRRGTWWEDRKQAVNIAADPGSMELDDVFSPIYEIDEGDNPTEEVPGKPGTFTEEAKRLWIKPNPSYGDIVREDRMANQILKAKSGGMDMWTELYRAQFSMPRYGGGGWLTDPEWMAVQAKARIPAELLEGHPLHLAVDLAPQHDFTALAKTWTLPAGVCAALPDGGAYVEIQYYTGAETLPERQRLCGVDLLRWAERGFIKTSPGAMLDYGIVAKDIAELKKRHKVFGMAVDVMEVKYLNLALEARGLEVRELHAIEDTSGQPYLGWVDHLQKFKWTKRGWKDPLTMRSSIAEFERAVRSDPPRVAILFDPVTQFCFTCVRAIQPDSVMANESNKGLDKVTKNSQREKIDGIIALVMGYGYSVAETRKPFTLTPEQMMAAMDEGAASVQ